MTAGPGGGLEGDRVAEGLELAEVVALDALSVDAGVVEAGAQVMEVGLWVGQQVPGDDQDGPADRDNGALLAASASDPPVAFTEEDERVTLTTIRRLQWSVRLPSSPAA